MKYTEHYKVTLSASVAIKTEEEVEMDFSPWCEQFVAQLKALSEKLVYLAPKCGRYLFDIVYEMRAGTMRDD